MTSARVKRVSFGLYAKETFLDEPLVVQYVAANTSIPVPEILDVIPFGTSNEYSNLVIMTTVPGQPISATQREWGEPSDERNIVFRDVLTDWLGQLRRLPAPDSVRVCGFLGGPFKSYRINGESRVGPFASPREFHSQYYFAPDVSAYEDEETKQLIEARPDKDYKLILTHGDLSFHNILVDDSFRPVGLIDWECAGWLPEYWEYTKSLYPIFYQNHIWKSVFDHIFPSYNDEFRVEFESWKWWHPDY